MQFPKRQLPMTVLAAAIGPNHVVAAARGTLTHPSRSDRPPLQPNLTFGKLTFGKLPSWEVATLEIGNWKLFSFSQGLKVF